MELRLENKVSLVCAASEGLGKASAIELAKEGSTVAICSRSKEKLLLAKEDIKKSSSYTDCSVTLLVKYKLSIESVKTYPDITKIPFSEPVKKPKGFSSSNWLYNG